MAIKGRLIVIYNEIIAVNFYRAIIIQDRKNEDFSIKLFLALYRFKQFHDTFYNNCYTVRVLSVYNIEYYGTVLYFAGKEREVH